MIAVIATTVITPTVITTTVIAIVVVISVVVIVARRLGDQAELRPDLERLDDAVEEHDAVHPAVARVSLLGVLREAAADLDAARIGRRRHVRSGRGDAPRISGRDEE